jgi:hypothetical protein
MLLKRFYVNQVITEFVFKSEDNFFEGCIKSLFHVCEKCVAIIAQYVHKERSVN